MILTANSDFEKLWGITKKEYYSKQYLTFEALEDCLFVGVSWTMEFLTDASDDLMKHISYSLDNGETWTTQEINDEEGLYVEGIKAGQTVLWKGDGLTANCGNDEHINFVSSTGGSNAKFNVYGNIMSLLYGDDFEGKEFDDNFEDTMGWLFENSYVVSAKNLILPDNVFASCYQQLFNNCTELTEAPELPATTLANGCYADMFQGCTSLVNAPVLPATTLADGCYSSMFLDDYKLTTAPELPALTLEENCYSSMFEGCESLEYIKMLATDISAADCLTHWTNTVYDTGTLTISSNYNGTRSALNIPDGWTVLNEDGTPHIFPRNYSEEYLTFECIDNDGGNFEFNIPLDGNTISITSVSYSLDNGQNWTTYENEDNDINISLNLSAGDKILLKGIAIEYATVHTDYDSPDETYSNIHLMGSWSVYGNIMSLFYGDNFVGKTSFPKDGSSDSSYNCAGLFYQNDECNMGDLSNLILPATTLTQHCYYMMFANCVGAITKAPELPATTLVQYCYSNMFNGCSSLNYIKAMFTTTPSRTYTENWVNGVASTGTFVKNSSANWNVTGTSGVPTGWTVETV